VGSSILLGVYLFAVLVSTHLLVRGSGVPLSGHFGHIHSRMYVDLDCPVESQKSHLVMLHGFSGRRGLAGQIGGVPFSF
jgi:hypothetical protein